MEKRGKKRKISSAAVEETSEKRKKHKFSATKAMDEKRMELNASGVKPEKRKKPKASAIKVKSEVKPSEAKREKVKIEVKPVVKTPEENQEKAKVGVKPETATPSKKVDNSSSSDKKKKKRRPWRQAVRNHARALRREEESNPNDEKSELAEPSKNHLRNKRRKEKKRRFRDGVVEEKQAKQESDDEDENTAENRLAASRFRFINEKLYTSTSETAKQMFEEDREAFDAYHRGYRLQAKTWPINPVDKMIRDLAALPSSSVVADVGCGDAKIAKELGDRMKIHSFDLVAANERVTAADMARLPLENESVDVAVYCLSLMGTNLSRFLREANRILKVGGRLKICEVSSRFRSVPKFTDAVEKLGFKLKVKVTCILANGNDPLMCKSLEEYREFLSIIVIYEDWQTGYATSDGNDAGSLSLQEEIMSLREKFLAAKFFVVEDG